MRWYQIFDKTPSIPPEYQNYYNYDFEVILYSTGEIIFHYRDIASDNEDSFPHSIGIEDNTGLKGVAYFESISPILSTQGALTLKFLPK